jgi:beta-glucanase (GH16 family)
MIRIAPFFSGLIFFSAVVLHQSTLPAVWGQSLPTDDLVLWLDAGDAGTIDVSEEGWVQTWRDKSPEHHDAVAEKTGPLLVKVEDGQSPRVRFTHNDRPTPLRMSALTEKLGPLTVFVVAQRNQEQSGRGKWQRLLSIREPEKVDNKGDGLAMTLKRNGDDGSFPPAIYSYTKSSVAPHRATLGTTAVGQPGGGLLADVCEVLVYASSFDDHRKFERVQDFLAKKWNVNVARDVGGWIRSSPLPEAPPRLNAHWPLFDQANASGWRKIPELSDEFNTVTLDDQKWWDHYPAWHGRVPARFLPENIRVAEGCLSLTLRKDTTLPREHLHHDVEGDYFDYSAAAVVSKTAIAYGCFEVRIKPAHATCTSSFWFNGGAVNQDEVQRKNEIDVFELAAGHKGHEQRFGMNMHVFKEPETETPWSNWGNWEAPFEWSEDFHTVNLVWSPDWIRYYVDGHCVRATPNVAWHVPLQMIFDMEIMSWLPHPKDSALPATYSIDYVRSWTRDDWKADSSWTPILDPKKETGVTKAVQELTEKRAKEKPTSNRP